MASMQSDHRARVNAMLAEAYGASGRALPVGAFTIAHKPLEKLDRSGVERKAQVVFKPHRPFPEGNNPLTGRELGMRELVVRLGYVLEPEGNGVGWDARGAESGAADRASVEDRGETDAKLLREVLGWQPNWTGLDPSVIDCAPHPEGDPDLIELPDRAIREVRFILKTRATSSGYGPAQ